MPGLSPSGSPADPPYAVSRSEQRLCHCPRRLHGAGAGRGGSDHGHAGPGCEYPEISPALGSLPGKDLPRFSTLESLSWELPEPRTQSCACTPTKFWD